MNDNERFELIKTALEKSYGEFIGIQFELHRIKDNRPLSAFNALSLALSEFSNAERKELYKD